MQLLNPISSAVFLYKIKLYGKVRSTYVSYQCVIGIGLRKTFFFDFFNGELVAAPETTEDENKYAS